MKILFKALCCGVIISCLFSLSGFFSACDDIRDRVFRLHIIANSDSPEDQALKLRVRDEITEDTKDIFRDCRTKDEAIKAASENIDDIRHKAQEIIKKNGSSLDCDAYVTRMNFDTRVYEDFSLPGGSYDALRIVIGEGQGHNWWCVLYPAVCVPCAEKDIGSALSENETDIVHDSDRYAVGFRFVEVFEDIRSFFTR